MYNSLPSQLPDSPVHGMPMSCPHTQNYVQEGFPIEMFKQRVCILYNSSIGKYDEGQELSRNEG